MSFVLMLLFFSWFFFTERLVPNISRRSNFVQIIFFLLLSCSGAPCFQNHQGKQDFQQENGQFCSPIKLPLLEEGKIIMNWFIMEMNWVNAEDFLTRLLMLWKTISNLKLHVNHEISLQTFNLQFKTWHC